MQTVFCKITDWQSILANALLATVFLSIGPELQSVAYAGTPSAGVESSEHGPFLATGMKVGEVTPNGAIVWARLTQKMHPNRNGYDHRGVSSRNSKVPKDVNLLWGACPGTPGQLRIRYGLEESLASTTSTEWTSVNENTDFTHQFVLSNLTPSTTYYYAVETAAPGSTEVAYQQRGRFRTAPSKETAEPVLFTAVTGLGHRDLTHDNGYRIFRSMLELKPSFFVPTGDTVYLDSDWPRTTNVSIARYHWQRATSLPRHTEFLRYIPSYWMKDDHDVFVNDCWPTLRERATEPFRYVEGQQIFLDYVPMSERTYRTFRWGRDLQIWIVEARDFRVPNDSPDGPEKTLWGEEQKAWLKKTMSASDATWKVLLSPTPIVGPPREGKFDNHSSAFLHEGREVRHWLAKQNPERVFIICGDIHFQYHSQDPDTGLQEFSCGPAGDEHSGGAGKPKPQCRFRRVAGGFLSVAVLPSRNESRLRFRFHDETGKVVYEYAVTATL